MTIAIQDDKTPKGTLLPSLAFYVLGASIGLALFVGAFALDLFASDEVLFYRGLKLIALAAVTQFVVTLLLRRLLNRWRDAGISIHHQIATISLAVGLNMTFLIVVPVTLDRSVSVFLLGVMNERPTETFSARAPRNRLRHGLRAQICRDGPPHEGAVAQRQCRALTATATGSRPPDRRSCGSRPRSRRCST